MKQIYHHNGIMYLIHRHIPITFFTDKDGILNMENVKIWRDYLNGVDHVLRTDANFLFVETIQEAIMVEDNN
jgi:hypothetical protein